MSTVMTPYNIKPTTALLGEVVTWNSKQETEINTVRSGLAASGLPVKYAKDLRTRSAFARAKNHLKENRSIDKVVEDQKKHLVTFQLDQKQIVQIDADHKRLQHLYECQITLNTETGVITCDNAEIQAQARTLFEHAMKVRTANDITTLVQKLFQDNADLFPINPEKGVAYFVPERHRDFTARVEQFMEQVGGRLHRWPVPKGTDEGNKSVRDAVQDGLSAIIDELDETVDKWDEKTRKSTQDKVVTKYKLLRHKAQVYSEYLQHTAADVNAKLDQSKGKLLAKLQKMAELKAESDK